MNSTVVRNPVFGYWRVLLAVAILPVAAASSRATETGVSAALRLISPRDYQVFQRAGRDGGQIAVDGALPTGLAGTETLEARVVGEGLSGDWRKLATLVPGQTDFRAKLDAPSGGWRRLEARVTRDGQVVAEAAVAHVGVGEVFVVAGQSNSANHGEEKQKTETGLVAAFSGSEWRLANDPQPGASGGGGSFMAPFGDAMVRRFNVPVGILAAGAGGTSAREWLPAGSVFTNPPTVTGNVRQLPNGEWESKGILFENLASRLNQLGPRGFRAMLWHQGESDAHQADPTRTLAGALYTRYLEQLLHDARRESGWEFPCFVAKATYHTPDDTGSDEIRAAQEAVWKSGAALEGPDTDALNSDFRENGGKGVHFNGKGLREHAALWVAKVGPWLDQELAAVPASDRKHAPPKLDIPRENFGVEGRPAFVILPPEPKRASPQPWILYAPTLPGYPDEAERWMHQRFLAAGVAVAGVDIGEAYGSPKGRALFDALYRELTGRRGFAAKPCLFGRSRGGLWTSSWAIANPSRVAGLIGVYPVFDFRTYPGITNAAPAYGLSPAELAARSAEFNPIEQIGVLAKAAIPVALLHGDTDQVVPLKQNSQEFVLLYREAGAESLARLIVIEGQGHNFYEGFFHSQELVDFAIARARAGAGPGG
jgi:pimeloyl-ACP methyl ester carboxylesterase